MRKLINKLIEELDSFEGKHLLTKDLDEAYDTLRGFLMELIDKEHPAVFKFDLEDIQTAGIKWLDIVYGKKAVLNNLYDLMELVNNYYADKETAEELKELLEDNETNTTDILHPFTDRDRNIIKDNADLLKDFVLDTYFKRDEPVLDDGTDIFGFLEDLFFGKAEPEEEKTLKEHIKDIEEKQERTVTDTVLDHILEHHFGMDLEEIKEAIEHHKAAQVQVLNKPEEVEARRTLTNVEILAELLNDLPGFKVIDIDEKYHDEPITIWFKVDLKHSNILKKLLWAGRARMFSWNYWNLLVDTPDPNRDEDQYIYVELESTLFKEDFDEYLQTTIKGLRDFSKYLENN